MGVRGGWRRDARGAHQHGCGEVGGLAHRAAPVSWGQKEVLRGAVAIQAVRVNRKRIAVRFIAALVRVHALYR